MGKDDFFQKRRLKLEKAIIRRRKERLQYSRALIVTEGETEEKYLKNFVASLKMSGKRIECLKCPEGTDPKTIVRSALNKAGKNTEYFDNVFCIFDGTGNTTLTEAISLAEAHSHITAIVSYPCFEYWILCHYAYTTAGYNNEAELIKKIKVKDKIPAYEKPMPALFAITSEKLVDAINNAKKAFQQSEEVEESNPSTNMFLLIEHLIEMSEEEK